MSIQQSRSVSHVCFAEISFKNSSCCETRGFINDMDYWHAINVHDINIDRVIEIQCLIC